MHAPSALTVAVVRKFADTAPPRSPRWSPTRVLLIFPLLLVVVSVLGFVLEDDPSLQDDVLDSAFGRTPVIGAQLRRRCRAGPPGSTTALVIGLAGALGRGSASAAVARAFDVTGTSRAWSSARACGAGCSGSRC